MKYEKIFMRPGGRQILVKIDGSWNQDFSAVKTEIQVLIREGNQQHFQPAIGPAHPKYWKVRAMDPEKVKAMQIKYSGVTAKQLRKALNEFELCFMDQSLVCENK